MRLKRDTYFEKRLSRLKSLTLCFPLFRVSRYLKKKIQQQQQQQNNNSDSKQGEIV